MLEIFLILLSGGILLAAAAVDPQTVTLNWLRLAGILALSFAGVALVVVLEATSGRMMVLKLALLLAIILLQLAAAQTNARQLQRFCCLVAALVALMTAWKRMESFVVQSSSPGGVIAALTFLGLLGIAAMLGFVLMDMLLGHAYLTAAKMSMAPFRRLNLALIVAIATRWLCNIFAIAWTIKFPIEMFWPRDGLLAATRWLVGLLVPAVFVYMAHDCIRRRATQSATGILYVAGVLIFIGEIVALQLIRDSGLPF